MSEIDPNQQAKQLNKDDGKLTIHQQSVSARTGEVLKAQILAEKVRNRKVTHVSHLELFQVDVQELARHLRNKCQASVTVGQDVVRGGGGKETSVVTVQGNMIREVEESLTKRYMVPQKYIESTNRLPQQKKRKAVAK